MTAPRKFEDPSPCDVAEGIGSRNAAYTLEQYNHGVALEMLRKRTNIEDSPGIEQNKDHEERGRLSPAALVSRFSLFTKLLLAFVPMVLALPISLAFSPWCRTWNLQFNYLVVVVALVVVTWSLRSLRWKTLAVLAMRNDRPHYARRRCPSQSPTNRHSTHRGNKNMIAGMCALCSDHQIILRRDDALRRVTS